MTMFALNALARAHFIEAAKLLGAPENRAAEEWAALTLEQVQISEKAMLAALTLIPELGAGALQTTLEELRPRDRNATRGLLGMVRKIAAEPEAADPAGAW